jgi:hypothetical protein
MYKVFVNDKPLFWQIKFQKKQISIVLESIDIEQLIIKIFQNKIQKPISIIPMKRKFEAKTCLQKQEEALSIIKGWGFVYFQERKMGFT